MKDHHPHAWNLVRFFLMVAPLSRMIPSTPGATVAKTLGPHSSYANPGLFFIKQPPEASFNFCPRPSAILPADFGGRPLEKLKTSTRQVEGVTVVDLSGRITLGEASVVVRDVINDLMGKGNKKILLNLVGVNYIDSSGIGVLVSSFSTVRSQGGELKLVNLSKRIRDLLQITKVYNLFDVKDDEAAAVGSFR